MQLLGLRQCRDTIVGTDDVKGISGGEKRRLSLALQMLLEPAVLLLCVTQPSRYLLRRIKANVAAVFLCSDEPTSGLDTFTARHVMETLKALATRGRTVILSIHQPRSDGTWACYPKPTAFNLRLCDSLALVWPSVCAAG